MDEEQVQENPELEPLKKYLLLQKLENLKWKLEQNELESSSLDTFLKFGKNLSYETILSVTNSFVSFFEKQLNQGEEVNNAE